MKIGKKKYKGNFNWHGEQHELFVWAVSKSHAAILFVWRLAKKLDSSPLIVSGYFDGTRDNYRIEEVSG